MSISHYSYKYGHGSKEFSLESDRVIKEVTVAKMPLLKSEKAAVLHRARRPTKPWIDLWTRKKP